MSYERKSVSDIISEDVNRKMFLPAIQREYVWSTFQIEKLFDSIMGDYPISSFLFWRILEENKKDWDTYEFISDFDKEKPHNKEANLSGVNKDIYLVLDGQQRLTSLLIGLKGSYRYLHYKWRKTRLYLNLLKKPIKNEEDPEELVYQFKFMEEDALENTSSEYWYEVSRILDDLDAEDAKESIEKNISEYSDSGKINAKKLIGRLHSRIHTHKLINYYEEKTLDYDKIVEIFIRTNTGGEKLEYSDILLSTATAKWKNLNAREEIQKFRTDINTIGQGYNFGKDFILKGSLFLTEDLPIQYKIKNFTKTNLEKIESNWEEVKRGITDTVKFISRCGLNRKNITSAAGLLPIASYLSKKRKNYILSTESGDVINLNLIQQWLILALLKNAYGGSSDSKLKNSRDALNADTDYSTFPARSINSEMGLESKFSDLELNKLLATNYKTRYSYSILSLLYPNRDWNDKIYNEDHIYPKSEFTTSKLKKRGYDEERIKSYQEHFNSVGNLQLITETENKRKSAKPFDDWIATRDLNFKERHLIPNLESYDFDQFLTFVEKRNVLLKSKLEAISV